MSTYAAPYTYLTRYAAVAAIRAAGWSEAEDVEFFLTMAHDGYGYEAATLRADLAGER